VHVDRLVVDVGHGVEMKQSSCLGDGNVVRRR
jgi:hypothetical protein